MGCWNKTCGLTNLPIMCGEKTYVFVLERVPGSTQGPGVYHMPSRYTRRFSVTRQSEPIT
jgi:hypothetical protein